MREDDFKFYQKMLYDRSGLALGPDKTYLLLTRLGPVAKALGFETLDLFTDHLRKTMKASDLDTVVDAMTTNETSFFRDIKPFQILKANIFPDLIARRAAEKRIRIWSAACSTGQEAYSIAMTIRDMGEVLKGWSIEITGTDISDSVLERARAGVFNNFEIQRGLSMPMIVKNFTQVDRNWVIKDELRAMAKFKNFNLLQDARGLGTFDLVFCRNVLIYFDVETKLKVLKSIAGSMAPDGVLVLGSTENVISERSDFVGIESLHGFYVKKTFKDKAK
jgi:chemotaxis protein methyltransferase CheR